ncbi:hypothetical protein ZIOFF_043135 [Zingiber officinale]|uniref:DUF985 domain-containing protein n=1 Tax=Zingiber officinale TaxID=94328 RepID=A0A8J5GA65_ZINOF|nr:hypothetical protein ZIOFF_043135 [Zingiber officinale]
MVSLAKKASELVEMLDLKIHPEGGFYTETFRDFSVTLSKSQLPPQSLSISDDNLTQDKVDRPVSTSIYFLLPAGSVSHLHRIPCAETWHFYSGEPLTVFELHDDGQIELTVLGFDLDAGHRPQYTVPPNVWFGSFPTLDVSSFSTDGSLLVRGSTRDPELHYSLVGCTCAPAFQFDDFELAKLSDIKALAPQAQPFFDYLVIPDKEA